MRGLHRGSREEEVRRWSTPSGTAGPTSGVRNARTERRRPRVAVGCRGGWKALGGTAGIGTVIYALGIGPRDLIAILQAIKAAGAIQAEIEVM